jgi:cytochrome c-type biogenesis protein CcmE
MKRTLSLFLIVIAALSFAAAGLTPSDVIKSPEQFDNKIIKVQGVVKKFYARTSKAGKDYITFELTSGTNWIAIYGHGKLDNPLKDGDRVEVVGKFAKLKTVGKVAFKNELDCSGKKGEKPNISTVK